MKHPEITKLYKYKAINESTLQMLINMKMWCASPDSFNDPFECKFNIISDFTRNEHKEYLLKYHAKETTEETRQMLQEFYTEEKYQALLRSAQATHKTNEKVVSKCGILSLSETYDNILMWSHYAADHTGICIEFDRTEEFLVISELTHKVRYSEQFPTFHYFDLLNKSFTFVDIIAHKNINWSYEKEWRVILENSANSEFPLPSQITEIIFGLKTPHKHIEMVYNILEKHVNITYSQMVMDESNYKLIKVPLNINRKSWDEHLGDTIYEQNSTIYSIGDSNGYQ